MCHLSITFSSSIVSFIINYLSRKQELEELSFCQTAVGVFSLHFAKSHSRVKLSHVQEKKLKGCQTESECPIPDFSKYKTLRSAAGFFNIKLFK